MCNRRVPGYFLRCRYSWLKSASVLWLIVGGEMWSKRIVSSCRSCASLGPYPTRDIPFAIHTGQSSKKSFWSSLALNNSLPDWVSSIRIIYHSLWPSRDQAERRDGKWAPAVLFASCRSNFHLLFCVSNWTNCNVHASSVRDQDKLRSQSGGLEELCFTGSISAYERCHFNRSRSARLNYKEILIAAPYRAMSRSARERSLVGLSGLCVQRVKC